MSRKITAAEWDRSFKAGEHAAMKRLQPRLWAQLFFAKYNKWPKMPVAVAPGEDLIGRTVTIDGGVAPDGIYTVEDGVVTDVEEIVNPEGEATLGGPAAAALYYRRVTDSKKWDRAFKADEITAMKKADPTKYQRLFKAKYGRTPN